MRNAQLSPLDAKFKSVAQFDVRRSAFAVRRFLLPVG